MAVTRWLPRAMTTEELALIRSDNQFSELFLVIVNPPSVYTARVNQTFSTKDRIVQVTFDGGVGTLADVKPGMTMYVGSTLGGYDMGIVRIRKDPVAGTLYVGENSEVLWADDLYLTVVDDFGLWPRHINIASNVPYMDWDIAYSNQHTNTNPVPIVGPRLVPVWLTPDGTVEVPFDGSLSYTFPDTSISGYLWAAPGASATSGLTTVTPLITYDTPGRYRVSLTLTAANGKVTVCYIYVYVFDEFSGEVADVPTTQFDLKSCTTSYQEGNWKFSVTLYAQADLENVHDRAMVCLFAKDYYGTTQQSIGQIPDRGQIKCIGWINGQSIVENPDGGSVDFTVEGAGAWLKRMSVFPIGIQNNTVASSAWTNWFGLTVDKSLYHLFFWQSTIIPVIDVFLTADTKISQQQYASGDTTIYDQIQYLLRNTLLGGVGSDLYNRLMCFIDPQITPPANRTDFETIIELTKEDWRDTFPITRAAVDITSLVNLTGVVINPPVAPTPIFSLAPGHGYQQWGRPVKQDRMLLSSQSQANQLAAMKLAWDNHLLDFAPDLAGNNPMLDVFPPYQFVEVSVDEEDTPREFIYIGRTLVREISMSWERSREDTGFLQYSWRMEQETFPGNSTNGDMPESSVPTSGFPPATPLPPLPLPPPIAVAPPDPEGLQNLEVWVAGQGMFYTKNLSGPGLIRFFSMNEGLPDPTLVTSFEISASGKCFCQVGFDAVYSAPYPGAEWELVFDTSMILNPESYPFPRNYKIISMGINRDADDELLIAAGLEVTIFASFILYNYKGTSAGVTLATPTFYNDASPAAQNAVGNITYGDGRWVVSYRSGGGLGILTTTEFDEQADAPGVTTVLSALGQLTTRSRYAPSTVTGATDISVEVTDDNAVTWNSYETPDAPIPNSVGQSIISDAEGNRILVGTLLDGMQRSADGGATWGITSTIAAVQCVWNLGTPDDWLFSFIGQLCYTNDFGDTFVYRTGDLQSWCGALFSIVAIRHY